MPSKNPAIAHQHNSGKLHAVSIESFAAQYRLKTQVSGDGTNIIAGRVGVIYEFDADTLGVLIIPNPPRKRYWGCLRASLIVAGMTLVQDGDGEGSAVFDPDNPIQAKLAIRAAGIRRRRQLTPEQREKRIAFLPPRSGMAHNGPGTRRTPGSVERASRLRSKTRSAVSAYAGNSV